MPPCGLARRGAIKRKEADPEKEATATAAIEEAKAKLADFEGMLGEIKASFEPEPLSLVPWMQTMFALVDAGVTTIDVSPAAFPHTPLRPVFTSDNQSSVYGSEFACGAYWRVACDGIWRGAA